MRPASPHRDLAEAIARIVALVQRVAGAGEPDREIGLPDPLPPRLAEVAQVFDLSLFEAQILVMAAAVELQPGFDRVCAAAQGAERLGFPTFGLALAALPGAHWDALLPSSALRRLELVQLGEGAVLTERPLRLEESVLHALLGYPGLDPTLMALQRPLPARCLLPPAWTGALQAGQEALRGGQSVHLHAPTTADAVAIAVGMVRGLDRAPWLIAASTLPADPASRRALARRWHRDALLGSGVLVISVDGPGEARDFAALLSGLPAVVLASADPAPASASGMRCICAEPASFAERRGLWSAALSARGLDEPGDLDALVARFELDAPGVAALIGSAPSPASIRGAARAARRPELDDLAQRVEPPRPGQHWDQLVLPAPQMRALRAVSAQVRNKAQVLYRWGFAREGSRGRGTSALFSGPSGTGKTLAAEVLAAELELDLYRIDLSSVVSKYIGETEKNLRRVFDAAEGGGAILLFDEADALFGKRTEVRDSHDRHANVEVSYLLQRMEAYGGLAILTTNLRASVDTAFLRRIQFIVEFPFPDEAHRALIWRRAFPPGAPLQGIDCDRLARLPVAGGNIRSMARNAAFLAAEDRSAIGMRHLHEAARLEYEKLGRTLSPAETRGWM